MKTVILSLFLTIFLVLSPIKSEALENEALGSDAPLGGEGVEAFVGPHVRPNFKRNGNNIPNTENQQTGSLNEKNLHNIRSKADRTLDSLEIISRKVHISDMSKDKLLTLKKRLYQGGYTSEQYKFTLDEFFRITRKEFNLKQIAEFSGENSDLYRLFENIEYGDDSLSGILSKFDKIDKLFKYISKEDYILDQINVLSGFDHSKFCGFHQILIHGQVVVSSEEKICSASQEAQDKILKCYQETQDKEQCLKILNFCFTVPDPDTSLFPESSKFVEKENDEQGNRIQKECKEGLKASKVCCGDPAQCQSFLETVGEGFASEFKTILQGIGTVMGAGGNQDWCIAGNLASAIPEFTSAQISQCDDGIDKCIEACQYSINTFQEALVNDLSKISGNQTNEHTLIDFKTLIKQGALDKCPISDEYKKLRTELANSVKDKERKETIEQNLITEEGYVNLNTKDFAACEADLTEEMKKIQPPKQSAAAAALDSYAAAQLQQVCQQQKKPENRGPASKTDPPSGDAGTQFTGSETRRPNPFGASDLLSGSNLLPIPPDDNFEESKNFPTDFSSPSSGGGGPSSGSGGGPGGGVSTDRFSSSEDGSGDYAGSSPWFGGGLGNSPFNGGGSDRSSSDRGFNHRVASYLGNKKRKEKTRQWT